MHLVTRPTIHDGFIVHGTSDDRIAVKLIGHPIAGHKVDKFGKLVTGDTTQWRIFPNMSGEVLHTCVTEPKAIHLVIGVLLPGAFVEPCLGQRGPLHAMCTSQRYCLIVVILFDPLDESVGVHHVMHNLLLQLRVFRKNSKSSESCGHVFSWNQASEVHALTFR